MLLIDEKLKSIDLLNKAIVKNQDDIDKRNQCMKRMKHGASVLRHDYFDCKRMDVLEIMEHLPYMDEEIIHAKFSEITDGCPHIFVAPEAYIDKERGLVFELWDTNHNEDCKTLTERISLFFEPCIKAFGSVSLYGMDMGHRDTDKIIKLTFDKCYLIERKDILGEERIREFNSLNECVQTLRDES